MNFLYFTFGTMIFLLIVADIVKTAFSSNGGGKLTAWVSLGIWHVFFRAAGKKANSKLLEYAGPTVLVSILLVWVIGMWLGFFILLLSDVDSVINSTTKANTDTWEKLYYAGFTLSTLGIGDYIPSNNFWRVFTNIAAYSGLVFITTSITYFVPVLSAVSLKSKLSLYINSMGKSPQQILLNSWNGKDFNSFFENVSDLCQMLIHHTMNHHSYPVIHYFHKSKIDLAFAPAFVMLDEVHQLLSNVIKDDISIDTLKMKMLQTTLDQHLKMLQKSYLNGESPIEETPNFTQLLKEKEDFFKKAEDNTYSDNKLEERRKWLTIMLEKTGWSWDAVHNNIE